MSEADLRTEIEALRREIAALRRERVASAEPCEDPGEAAPETNSPGFIEQLQTLAHEITAFAEDTERGVANHPLTSVLGALILGMLIGRAIR
jgi:cell division septum initiation protein DivIVA